MSTAQGQPQDSPVEKYRGASTPNRVGYNFMELDPGDQIYVQRDDQLIIQAMSSIPAEVLNIGVRTLIPGRDAGPTQPDAGSADNHLGDSPFGTIAPLVRTLPMSSGYVVFSQTIQMAEGFLLSIAISSTLATTRGATFVKAFIVRAGTAAANAAYMLCADYVTNNAPIGFPFGRCVSPLEGPGNLFSKNMGSFGAGAELSIDPSPNSRIRVASVQAQFVASGSVANRNIAFKLRDITNTRDCGQYPANVVVTAGQTVQVTGAPGIIVSTLIPLDLTIPIPQPLYLAFNSNQRQALQSATQNIQAADQWSAVNVAVEEWLDF